MKAEISVLNSNLERYGLISDYQSFSFIRHYNDIGEFTLVLSADCHEAHLLHIGSFILVNNDSQKFGFIHNRYLTEDEEGNETFTYKGKTLGAIFEFRTMLLNENEVHEKVVGNIESILHTYVFNHLINPFDPNRRIPNLVQTKNQNRGENIIWISNTEYLIDTIKSISDIYNFGWEITADVDNNQWIFNVYKGLDLSINQDENPQVVFSKDLGNIKTMAFAEDSSDLRNFAYVLSDDDESNHVRSVSKGDVTGFNRKEILFNISKYDDDEEYVDVVQLASQQLEEYYTVQNIEAEVIEDCGIFKLGRDYNLGDIVTVENKKWKVTEDLVIMTIEEAYSNVGKQTFISFGKRIPSLIAKIKRDTKVREIK
ncbi:MAG: siphovirus ReqiPepy6 Gp37-like family protein [Erysipelotrichaceae bacterium]